MLIRTCKDSRMLIQLFDYDAQIALDQGETSKEPLTVEYEANPSRLEALKREYQEIIECLDKLAGDGKLSDFDRTTLVETANDVKKEIAKYMDKFWK